MSNFKVGDKVLFEYYDYDACKDVFGRGWVREIDDENHSVIVNTTRGLKWMEPAAIRQVIKAAKPIDLKEDGV